MTLYRFFSLVNQQAKMNLKAEASRFILSYLWWIMEPLLFVMVFYFVFEILLNRGRGDFLLFLICGKIPFVWFSKSVVAASTSIVQSKGLINQIDIPKILFPYVAAQQALYKQWVVFFLLFAIVGFYGHFPSLEWVLLLPIIFVEYLLILCFSIFVALMVCYVSDVKILVNMAMMFLMFSSGIFWDINSIADPQIRNLLLLYNPIAFILDAYRQILMYESVYDYAHMAYLGTILALVLLGLHMIFRRLNKTIAAKVMN